MFNLQEEFNEADQRRKLKAMAENSDNLKQAKRRLEEIAEEAKKSYPTDRPAIRMIINDSAHSIAEDQDLTDNEADSLHDTAASLHP